MYTVRDFTHRRRLGDLLTAEPPVVFIRVVLPVIEVPIRRGFALSHAMMLTPSCSAAANAARSLAVTATKWIGSVPSVSPLRVRGKWSGESQAGEGVSCEPAIMAEPW